MKKMLRIGILAFLLSACVGGQPASTVQDQAAKRFMAPQDGTAAVYIYRNEIAAAAVGMDILIDGKYIATTGPRTYLVRHLTPGDHKIEGKASGAVSSLVLKAQPNRIYYVWQETKMGLWGAQNQLHQTDEQTGQFGVLSSSLIE